MLEHFELLLRGPKKGTEKDMFDEETLKECKYFARPPGTTNKSMVTNLLEELATANEENEKMREEIPALNEKNKRLNEKIKKE